MSQLTPDNILDDEENHHLSQVIAIKKHIYSYINQAELIRFFLHIIDSTEFISFERQSDRRFINLKNLSLSLEMDIKKAAKKYPSLPNPAQTKFDKEGHKLVLDVRSALLHEVIVAPFSSMINTMLHVVLHQEVPDSFEYTDWMLRILPEDFESLTDSINNFSDVKDNKDRIEKDFFFLFSMASAFVFPPEEVDMNQDTGFTIEFLL